MAKSGWGYWGKLEASTDGETWEPLPGVIHREGELPDEDPVAVAAWMILAAMVAKQEGGEDV